MSQVILFANANIVRDNAIVKGSLFVQNGIIIPPVDNPHQTVDLEGRLISPGLIDLQVNGGFGVDFTSQPEKIGHVCKNLPRYGITSFLLTLISQPLEKYPKILATLSSSEECHGAYPLGIHIEGPHFSKNKKGSHKDEYIVETCKKAFWAELLAGYHIKMVTLAPELEGAIELISYAAEQGVVVSCGHTEADSAILRKAKAAGLKFVTHLYNAMKPLQARDPGPIGFVLGDRALEYSLIADGHHVSPEAIRLAWNAYKEGLILVSDASSLLGMETGVYQLGTEKIEVQGKKSVLQGTSTLAGGMCPLNEMVVNLQKITSCSLVEAISCATIKPAKLLGLQGKKGSLSIGNDADFFVAESENLRVLSTYVGGEPCLLR
jgi:N-acetylglucosamine-6-phosphate deacetylase